MTYNPAVSCRLGIDLDGVVADFNAGWITRYNEEFGADVPLDAVRAWDGLHQPTHFPDAAAFWRWAAGNADGSVFRHLDAYDGAVEALGRLDDVGHEIVILTTKPHWAVHDTFAWIAEHRIPTREIHVLAGKWRVPCDVYLDDSPHQIRDIHRARPEALVCRFVRPWNGPIPGVRDIETWTEFTGLIEGRSARSHPGVG